METKRYSLQKMITFAIMAISMIAFAIISIQPTYAADSDIASGENWRITSDLELIIGKEGTETVFNLYPNSTPWVNYKDDINKISFAGKVCAYVDEDVGEGDKSVFKQCNQRLTTIDLSGLDTSKVTNMWEMFSGCSSLTSLDVSGFDTSKVTNMWEMFSGCSNLTSIDLSGVATDNVTDMDFMFSGCSNLTEIDVSGFDTSNVNTLRDMFSGCSSLTSLDVSGFDTSKVNNLGAMFSGCSSLTSLDVSGFDTSNVNNMWDMFSGCSSLTSLDVSGFDTSSVTNMRDMFKDCDSLIEIRLGPKSIFSAEVSFPSGKWTRSQRMDGTAAGGPAISDITAYTGTDPGWYKTQCRKGHNWNSEYTDDRKATYTTAGSKSIHCSVCNAIKEGSAVAIPKLQKKANTLKVSAAAKTVRAKKLKKNAQTVKVITVKNAKGTVSYKVVAGKAKAKKILKLNTKNGKITVKKKTKKGTYKIKVKVTAKGTTAYKSGSKAVWVTVRVK